MLTVHHLENSRSQRILWLLEELELEYEVKRYPRDTKSMLAPASLRAIHPLGKSPILTDGERTYVESGAIVEAVLERHGGGRFVPVRGTAEHDRYRYWMHYAEGSAMPPLLLKLVSGQIAKAPVPFFVRPVVRQIAKTLDRTFVDRQIALHFDWVESELAKRTWFAGDEMSGADILMSFPLEAAAKLGGEARPKSAAFLERIHERPAYQRALTRGGPYGIIG